MFYIYNIIYNIVFQIKRMRYISLLVQGKHKVIVLDIIYIYIYIYNFIKYIKQRSNEHQVLNFLI